MGFLRNTGAALTMGLSATTKHKESEKEHESRVATHNSRIRNFNQFMEKTCEDFQQLADAWEESKETLIESGALTVDNQGTLSYGWYHLEESAESTGPDQDFVAAAAGSIPGFAAFIGAPFATWTLIGAFGVASTGAAISGLSGAAATAATAAWLGRAGLAGVAGLGMRAAPAALGGIAFAVTLPIQAVVGANIAGHRERKAIELYGNAASAMRRYESILRHHRETTFDELQELARRLTTKMVRDSARLVASLEINGIQGPHSTKYAESVVKNMDEAVKLLIQFQKAKDSLKSDLDDLTAD